MKKKQYNKNYMKYEDGGYINPMLQYGLTGASIGTTVGGPVGTAVGAGAGLVTGAVLGGIQAQKDKKLKMQYEQTLLEDKQQTDAMRYQNLNDFSTPYYMAKGGKVKGNAEIEDNEVVEVPNSTLPFSKNGGKLNYLSSNGYEADGNTHEEGGINTQLPQGTRIYSDDLKATTGKTFAKEASKLQKAKGDIENNLGIASNVKKQSIDRLTNRLNKLFAEQESMKYEQGGEMYATGGKVPNKTPLTMPDALNAKVPDLSYSLNTDIIDNRSTLPNFKPPVTNTPVTENNFDYSSILPYLSPVVQGIESLGKKEYMPKRRIDEGVTSILPGDREAELMTRSTNVRNREGLFTALKGVNRLASPASTAATSQLFTDYTNASGDIASKEAELKANFDNNRFNAILGIKGTNLNQARLEDENRLATDANSRNIRRQALGDTATVAQMQNYEGLIQDADEIKLAAVLANADPAVRKNYIKQLKAKGKYKNLLSAYE